MGGLCCGALVGLASLSLADARRLRHAPGRRRRRRPQPNAIGVNSYLWRATLDTLAFMPLASADPYGGVVITDWYVNPEKPDERFKCTVYILDTRLRGDALNVTVFKQVQQRRRRLGRRRRPPTRPRSTSRTPS